MLMISQLPQRAISLLTSTKKGINTGLSTLANDFQLNAKHDAISGGYIEVWLYYACAIELKPDFVHQVSY